MKKFLAAAVLLFLCFTTDMVIPKICNAQMGGYGQIVGNAKGSVEASCSSGCCYVANRDSSRRIKAVLGLFGSSVTYTLSPGQKQNLYGIDQRTCVSSYYSLDVTFIDPPASSATTALTDRTTIPGRTKGGTTPLPPPAVPAPPASPPSPPPPPQHTNLPPEPKNIWGNHIFVKNNCPQQVKLDLEFYVKELDDWSTDTWSIAPYSITYLTNKKNKRISSYSDSGIFYSPNHIAPDKEIPLHAVEINGDWYNWGGYKLPRNSDGDWVIDLKCDK